MGVVHAIGIRRQPDRMSHWTVSAGSDSPWLLRGNFRHTGIVGLILRMFVMVMKAEENGLSCRQSVFIIPTRVGRYKSPLAWGKSGVSGHIYEHIRGSSPLAWGGHTRSRVRILIISSAPVRDVLPLGACGEDCSQNDGGNDHLHGHPPP